MAARPAENRNGTAHLALDLSVDAKVVDGESLDSLMALAMPVLRERVGCSPNTHKSKSELVARLAKKLGILPDGKTAKAGAEAAVAEAAERAGLKSRKSPVRQKDRPMAAQITTSRPAPQSNSQEFSAQKRPRPVPAAPDENSTMKKARTASQSWFAPKVAPGCAPPVPCHGPDRTKSTATSQGGTSIHSKLHTTVRPTLHANNARNLLRASAR